MANRGSRGIALPFHDRGTRRGWGVSDTPRLLFTPGKDPVPILQEAVWAPGPVWTGAENLAPPEFDPRTIQPIASGYTDFATRPTFRQSNITKLWNMCNNSRAWDSAERNSMCLRRVLLCHSRQTESTRQIIRLHRSHNYTNHTITQISTAKLSSNIQPTTVNTRHILIYQCKYLQLYTCAQKSPVSHHPTWQLHHIESLHPLRYPATAYVLKDTVKQMPRA